MHFSFDTINEVHAYASSDDSKGRCAPVIEATITDFFISIYEFNTDDMPLDDADRETNFLVSVLKSPAVGCLEGVKYDDVEGIDFLQCKVFQDYEQAFEQFKKYCKATLMII